MICPACQRALVELTVAEITLDFCHGGCDGIWFDGGELEKLGESEEGQTHCSVALPVDPSIEVDESLPPRCPRCGSGAVMKQTRVGGGEEGVMIDLCEECGGVWLDHGEFESLQQM
jgi:Zn-finger nucleic acid-binding protein